MVGNGEGLVAAVVCFDLFALQVIIMLVCFFALLVQGLQRRLNTRSIGVGVIPLVSCVGGVLIAIAPSHSPSFAWPDKNYIVALGLVCVLPALVSLFVSASRWFPILIRCLYGLLATSCVALFVAIILSPGSVF